MLICDKCRHKILVSYPLKQYGLTFHYGTNNWLKHNIKQNLNSTKGKRSSALWVLIKDFCIQPLKLNFHINPAEISTNQSKKKVLIRPK